MRKYKGFSLSENVVVMVVLGVIITLVVPVIFGLRSNDTKQLSLRRAITNYQVILIKNLSGITGIQNTEDYNSFLRQDNYSRIVDRFDIRNSDCNENSCTFTTKNGIVWNVTTPSEALVSLRETVVPTIESAQAESDTNVFLVPFEVINGNFKFLITRNNDLTEAGFKTTNFINGD